MLPIALSSQLFKLFLFVVGMDTNTWKQVGMERTTTNSLVPFQPFQLRWMKSRHTLSTTSCVLTLVPCFLLFFFIFLYFFSYPFPASRYVYLLRVPLSVQQSSATLRKSVFYSTGSFCLCHLYPTPSQNYFVLVGVVFFSVPPFSPVACFLWLCSRTMYPSTWLAYLDPVATLCFSLSHCLWPHNNLYLSTMNNQEGHWGYCWCWLERKA